MSHTPPLSRRRFLAGSLAGVAAANFLEAELAAQQPADSRQATGVKVGEVSDTAAIVWMRLTAHAHANRQGKDFPRGKPLHMPKGMQIEQLRGACPGAAGQVRLRYSTAEDLADARSTDWQNVTAKTDFSHQFRLTGLKPATAYYYSAETAGPGGKPVHAPLRGRFATAPVPDQYADVTFMVLTGAAFKDLDHADGYHIFPAMAKLRPNFYIHTGDNVYYDNDGVLANTVDLARHHWHRMHSLPRHVDFHLHTPAYFEKDDHDCLQDDCWPTMNSTLMAPLTFKEGLGVFREVVPMSDLTYRTFRWGKGLQIWLTEGRDYRSPNPLKDGPNKTIWGKEQKQWLMQTMLKSDADFKVLISPTPIVGPDRSNKRDNHANVAFQHEGDEIRRFFQKNFPRNFCIACGDRHWQYHSVHPETGVHEFSCGPVSDIHAGGSPGFDKKYHRFHRVEGGFLSVSFRRTSAGNVLILRHHDVMGKVVNEHTMR